jgi:hypothetical protein
MRLAVSGSHGTGKSTLIAAFIDLRPDYRYEAEAYETLADDIPLTAAEGPSPEGLQSLLDYTIAAVRATVPRLRSCSSAAPSITLRTRPPAVTRGRARRPGSSWPRPFPRCGRRCATST